MGKKKIIKSNTIAGLWKNINKLASSFFNSDVKDEKLIEKIKKNFQEANESQLPNSILAGFVTPYMAKKKCSIIFAGEDDNTFGEWAICYDKETHVMKIDPLGLHNFHLTFKNANKIIKANPEIKENLKEFRQLSFMHELSKLPPQYFIYIAVLQEMAHINDIISIENRNGSIEKSDISSYLILLWAFKEFERFYMLAQHRSLRADYKVKWFEGEWIEERKTKGYV